jgi:hypothetical protein
MSRGLINKRLVGPRGRFSNFSARCSLVAAPSLEPQQWDWSSFRHYADGEHGPVLVNEPQEAEIRLRETG